jgi:hypothetical protein
MLRVAGDGGFWEKALTARAWRFVPTGGPALGRPVPNTRRDSTRRDLAPGSDRSYAGDGVAVPAFNLACSPALMVVDLGAGRRIGLTLHTVDTIRQTPRAAGLDDDPRLVNGTIEAPRAVLESRDPAVAAFAARHLTGGRFTSAPIEATTGALVFRDQGWRLARR